MAIDPGALLIGLREGLEALLVLGILLGMLRRFGHPEKGRLLWLGAAAGVAASVVVGLLVQRHVRGWFDERGGAAMFELVVATAAVGILTYMVVWMQKHTMGLLASAKKAVTAAVADGRWTVLATLAFVTVFREGLETVLFYAARAGDVSWATLVWSGLIGFAVSAAIAFAIFRLTVQVDLRKFFAITGILLVFIAAGLLIHLVHAAAELGWIGHGEPLWDTSGVLPDEDHWLGGPLHALIGYEDQPTAFALLLYLGYVLGVGGFYLASIARPERKSRARTAAAAVVAALLLVVAVAATVPPPGTGTDPHRHGPLGADAHAHVPHEELFAPSIAALEGFEGKVGVLVRAHGEPIHYNATTYTSFKEFVDGIWPYTGLPPEMLRVDQGTILIDGAHPFAEEPLLDAALVDAWLQPYTMPAIPFTDPLGLHQVDEELAGGQFYLAPGTGPGLGEGDVYEMLGLGTYRTWLKMGNESPMYGAVQEAWAYVAEHAAKHWGQQVVVAFAHHVDPHVDPNETLQAAAAYLAEQGVDVVVDAYMSSIHSSAMNYCMMEPHALHALEQEGLTDVVHAGMAGTTASWAHGVAEHVAAQVAALPADAKVAVHLVQHGADPTSDDPCAAEGTPEPYHANAKAEFAASAEAVREALGERNVTLRHVYGQGAGTADDGVLSPMEALDLDAQDGVQHAILVPYEFWGNAMDNLVRLRESLGATPDELPYYDANHETRLTYRGVDVLVTSARFSTDLKGEALLLRISEAIAGHLAPQAGPGQHEGHDGHGA